MLQQRTSIEARTLGHPNLRLIPYGHVPTDEELLDVAASTLVDPIVDSDEEDCINNDFSHLNDADSIPSVRLNELDERFSSYDTRQPDVLDVDFEDACTDIDILNYYYGWKDRKHRKTKYDHPYLLSEELFDRYGLVFPLVVDYATAQREDERIAKLIFKELPYTKDSVMTKEAFTKWKESSLGKCDPNEPIFKCNTFTYEEPTRRLTFDDAKQYLKELSDGDSQLRAILNRAMKSSQESNKPTRCWRQIAAASSTEGWFRDPYCKAVVHYDKDSDTFDNIVLLSDIIVARLVTDNTVDYYSLTTTSWLIKETHMCIPLVKALDCVPKMPRSLEFEFLERHGHLVSGDVTWITERTVDSNRK